MRKVNNFKLIGAALLSTAFASGVLAETTLADRLEMLEWSDPERAAQQLDAAPTLTADSGTSEVEMLEIRGMIYADSRRDLDVDAVLRRLSMIARNGSASAILGGRFVRAYSSRQHNQFAAANAELSHIDLNSIHSDTERYRVLILRGNVLRILGQDEAALPFLEQGLDLAHRMHDDPRTLHATLWLARIYTDSGNFDTAMVHLDSARRLATQ